jgi:hypothetical protein
VLADWGRSVAKGQQASKPARFDCAFIIMLAIKELEPLGVEV